MKMYMCKIAHDTFLKAFLNFIYPPSCFHCQDFLSQGFNQLCPRCFDTLDFFLANERCFHCFAECENERLCASCIATPSPFNRVLSVFECEGPAHSLLKKLASSHHAYLAKAAAAFMALQMIRTGFPLPDLVIATPQTFYEKWQAGYHPSHLIAFHLAAMLNRPLINPFRLFSFPFNFIKKSETIPTKRFHLTNPSFLEDKELLLIGIQNTFKGTYLECAEDLMSAYPKKIYGLTLCLTT